jgi:NADPH-dependent ferric siderophore reductase
VVDRDNRVFATEVIGNEWLTRVMRRLRLGGPGLDGFASSGRPDEWLRIFVPAEAVGEPGPDPLDRWYSVRRWDPVSRELTVDVVIHADGVATRWAEQAVAGDRITVTAANGRFEPPEDTEWVLVVADQTGLPAACRILDSLSGFGGHAILEAPDPGCVLPIAAAADVSWVFHPEPAASASPLAEAVRAFSLPAGQGYVWMAGEAACSRDIRRYVRHELGWKPARFDIVGYWRRS